MSETIDGKCIIFLAIACMIVAGCSSVPSIPSVSEATLEFISSPSGAQIYLDSQFKGTTPSTITDVEPGQHTLEFRYPGYNTYTAKVMVPSRASQFSATMTPLTTTPVLTIIPQRTSTVPVQSHVTIGVSDDPMIIGTSNLFSGTCTGSDIVLLTMSGPGAYVKGVTFMQVNVNAAGRWSYRWNPGTSLLPGTYTMTVTDAHKSTSQSVQFSVIGGGVVSIASSTYAASRGSTHTFSGQCTTGAPYVRLVLYGPERYQNGAEVGVFPVLADKSWRYPIVIDSTMPTGVYTMNVYDVPQTGSGNVQYTIGFA